MRALKRLDVVFLIIFSFTAFPCFGQDYETYINRGKENAKKGQYEKAISDFPKAIEINTRYAEAYYTRGVAYYKKGQQEKACYDLKRGCELGLCKNYELAKKGGVCK